MKNELSNYINELNPGELNSDNNTINIDSNDSTNIESGLPMPSNNFDNQEIYEKIEGPDW